MLHRKYLVIPAAVAACVIAAPDATASPGPIRDGDGAAKIVDRSFHTLASPGGENPILRAGNSKFGRAHIKQGGRHHHKPSHPYNRKAKKKWQGAFNRGICKTNGHYYTLYCYPFRAGLAKRTMCVWVDYADWKFHGRNMGQKGIVTAYVAKGQKGPRKHRGRDSCLAQDN
ncbi:hypothetical protein ACIG3E_23575 [Streptomyces sp. NPDC053474]|uniref:hypothetical protein n=1 Tax=Streptomyces sp. NPDC053474 TaxID=3365704 RepID=UPI0037CFDECE